MESKQFENFTYVKGSLMLSFVNKINSECVFGVLQGLS